MFPPGGGGDLDGRDLPPGAGRGVAALVLVLGLVLVILSAALWGDASGPMRIVLVVLDALAVGLGIYGLLGRRE